MRFHDLTVLGSGTILPLPNHGCSGYLLRGDTGTILLDCGPGTLYRLAEIGVPPSAIDAIFITHFHLDHVSDLAAILNSRWLANRARGGHRLEVVGPRGMNEHLAWLGGRMDSWFGEYHLSVQEAPSGPTEAAGITMRTLRTGHTEESIAYRLQDEAGTVLFYSGDTDYNEALLPLARRADVAIIECSMPDDSKLEGHLTPRLAARLASIAEVRRLVLTHFYEQVTHVDIRAQVSEVYSGPAILAQDKMRIDFGSETDRT